MADTLTLTRDERLTPEKREALRDILKGNLPPEVLIFPEDSEEYRDYCLACQYCKTDFVPKACKGSPANTFFVIRRARAMKLDPLYAFGVFYLAEPSNPKAPTKLGMETKAMRAILLRDGFQIEDVERTPQRSTVRITRPDGQFSREVTWTEKDAESNGLSDKWNWKGDQRKRLMNNNRAFSECVQLVAPDVFGDFYSREEIEDAMETAGERAERYERSVESAGEIDPDIISSDWQTRIKDAAHASGTSISDAIQEMLQIQKAAISSESPVDVEEKLEALRTQYSIKAMDSRNKRKQKAPEFQHAAYEWSNESEPVPELEAQAEAETKAEAKAEAKEPEPEPPEAQEETDLESYFA